MQKEKYPKVPFSCLNNIMKTSGARIRQESVSLRPLPFELKNKYYDNH